MLATGLEDTLSLDTQRLCWQNAWQYLNRLLASLPPVTLVFGSNNFRLLWLLILLMQYIGYSCTTYKPGATLSASEITDLLQTDLQNRWGPLRPFLKNGKWGFYSDDSVIALPATFHLIKPWKGNGDNPGIIIAQQQQKWGAVDFEGRVVIPFVYQGLNYTY